MEYSSLTNDSKSNEENINIVKVVDITDVAVSTPVIVNEIQEEIAVVSDIKPNERRIKEDTPETTNRYNSVLTYEGDESKIESTSELVLKSVEIEFEEAKPIEFEPKINGSKTEDVVTINHVDETVHFDTVKIRDCSESPFDFTPKNDSHKVLNHDDSNETPSLDYVLNKLSRYKSSFEDTNLKKSKSVAELDLGDAVRGKVQDMIVRMKSVERLGVEKREVINARERPRKKSVSEKIALFEVIIFD